MARQKKPKYEYVEQLGLYRKRVQDATGKYVAVYGQTQEELTEKLSRQRMVVGVRCGYNL